MNKTTKQICFSAMFIAIGLVLPFLTGQIPQIGKMLSPMHFPVFLCGLICGWPYGLVVGFVLPILRGALFSMPVLYPTGLAMAFELATYGLVSGLIYRLFKKRNIVAVYVSMICAMLVGRAVWGVAQVILLSLDHSAFTWQMFMSGAFINAVPAIVLQLVLIPAIMVALEKSGLIGREKTKRHEF